MKILTAALILAASAPVLAQTQTTRNLDLPLTNSLPRANGIPFASKVCRYQQWFAPAQLTKNLKRPIRIIGAQFRALTSTGPATTITMEMKMSNASKSGLGGSFAGNLAKDAVLVLPKTTVSLARASAGVYTLQITFTKDFKWDGESGVLFDVKVFGNSANKTIIYDFESTVLSKGQVQRIYNTSSATATSGKVDNGIGLHTRFRYQDGGSYSYGTGCPGPKNLVPVATSNRVPLVGDTGWAQIVSKVSPGIPSILFFGLSKDKWGPVTLPYDAKPFGWDNCKIYAEPFFLAPTKTSGGSIGTSSAVIGTGIPAIGSLAGLSIFSQWVVFDTNSPNGAASFSNALWHVIGT